jgi:hypothetical protein
MEKYGKKSVPIIKNLCNSRFFLNYTDNHLFRVRRERDKNGKDQTQTNNEENGADYLLSQNCIHCNSARTLTRKTQGLYGGTQRNIQHNSINYY